MDVEKHFFSSDNAGRADALPEEPLGVEDFHLGRSGEIMDEEEKRKKAAEDVLAEQESHKISEEHSGRGASTENVASEGGAETDGSLDLRAEYNLHEYGLSPDDRGKLERITDRGRGAFNGLLNVPGLDRAAARFGMKFDQYFLDKSNEETRKLNAKVKDIDDQIKLFNQKNEAAAAAAAANNADPNLAAGNSLAGILTRTRNEKIDELQRKKEQLMPKIGEHEAAAKVSETNRNRYVDWMRRKNNERIAPLKAKELKYKNELRDFDEKTAPLVIYFKGLKNEVELLEKEKVDGIKEAEEAGLNDKELKEEIKKFNERIKRRRKVLEEWEEIKIKRAKMEQRITRLNAKIKEADRSNEYKAILDKKPLFVTPRAEEAASSPNVQEENNVGAQNGRIPEEETNRENPETKYDAGDLLELWKEHFEQKVDKGFTIDAAVEEGLSLEESEQLTVAEFKQKIKSYYESRFSGATALLENIETARNGFATNEQELAAALRELDGKRQESEETPKFWIQDAIKLWNSFLQEKLAKELKSETDLGKIILLNPGEFVNKADISQNVSWEDFQAVVEKYYQKNPKIRANLRDRLEQEYRNFLDSKRESQA